MRLQLRRIELKLGSGWSNPFSKPTSTTLPSDPQGCTSDKALEMCISDCPVSENLSCSRRAPDMPGVADKNSSTSRSTSHVQTSLFSRSSGVHERAQQGLGIIPMAVCPTE